MPAPWVPPAALTSRVPPSPCVHGAGGGGPRGGVGSQVCPLGVAHAPWDELGSHGERTLRRGRRVCLRRTGDGPV